MSGGRGVIPGGLVRALAEGGSEGAPSQDEVGALAVDALLARSSAGVHRGGMAAGVTVKAGELHDLAAAGIARGDQAARQGDLVAAQRLYREAAAIMRRLSAAAADHVGFQRDLSVVHNRIATVLTVQGDHDGAIAQYRDSLAIMEQLVDAHPAHAGLQHDLAWCHDKIADAHLSQRRTVEALASCRAGLAVIERQLEAHPDEADWKRRRSVLLGKVAAILANRPVAPPKQA